MEVIFCTNCGSKQVDFDGEIYCCKSCGSKFEKKHIDSKMFVDLQLADEKRQSTYFEEAKKIYKKIITAYPDDDLTDAYWGLFLCEQKVIFEDDGKGEKFPSFYRINPTSVDDTPEFSKAITYALKHNKERVEIFNSLGEKIERARQMFLNISSTTKPFDVFICFKNSDFSGNPTPDKQLALDIYNEFNGKYNIFFSEKTLKNIKSSYRDYEPNIYYGLYTAKVMLLICSRKDYIESQWLKNEWSRFTQINKQGGENKCIIPIFTGDFNPNDLPEQLWHNQGIFDDRKLIANLGNQLESIVNPVDELAELKRQQEEARKEQEKKLRELESNLTKNISSGGNPMFSQIQNSIKAIKTFIEIGNFESAEKTLSELGKLAPNSFEYHWYNMLCSNKCKTTKELVKVENIMTSSQLKTAKSFKETDEHSALLNDLNKEFENYKLSILNRAKELLSKEKFEESEEEIRKYGKFEKNFDYEMVIVLAHNKKKTIEEYSKFTNALTISNYVNMKNLAKTNEELEICKNVIKFHNDYVDQRIEKCMYEYKSATTFDQIIQIQKRFDCWKENKKFVANTYIALDQCARQLYINNLQLTLNNLNTTILDSFTKEKRRSFGNLNSGLAYFYENTIMGDMKLFDYSKEALSFIFTIVDNDMGKENNEKIKEYLSSLTNCEEIVKLENLIKAKQAYYKNELLAIGLRNYNKSISKRVKTNIFSWILSFSILALSFLGILIIISGADLTPMLDFINAESGKQYQTLLNIIIVVAILGGIGLDIWTSFIFFEEFSWIYFIFTVSICCSISIALLSFLAVSYIVSPLFLGYIIIFILSLIRFVTMLIKGIIKLFQKSYRSYAVFYLSKKKKIRLIVFSVLSVILLVSCIYFYIQNGINLVKIPAFIQAFFKMLI